MSVASCLTSTLAYSARPNSCSRASARNLAWLPPLMMVTGTHWGSCRGQRLHYGGCKWRSQLKALLGQGTTLQLKLAAALKVSDRHRRATLQGRGSWGLHAKVRNTLQHALQLDSLGVAAASFKMWRGRTLQHTAACFALMELQHTASLMMAMNVHGGSCRQEHPLGFSRSHGQACRR